MLEKIAKFFVPGYKIPSTRKVIFMLFGLALFLRFPFFFRDYIDRDESTFIIMAQSWVDGYLPYTQLWDLKPPITFLFFASIIYVFGKSLLAIRFFGTVLVVITAIGTYKIGKRVASKKVGFWAALCCTMLLSMFGSVQGVMSEHISIALFCPALYLLISKKNWYWYLLSGVLMGLSIMSKLNMVYPAFFIGLFLLFEAFRKKRIQRDFVLISVWAFGILFLVALTAVPYLLEGLTEVWWQSIFEAPMAYASSLNNSILNVLPFCLILALLLLVLLKTKLLSFKKKNIQLLLVVVLGVVLSFVQAGKINGHYLIQLYPILLILLGGALSKLKWRIPTKFTPYLIVLALFLPVEAYLEYANIVENRVSKGTYFNGEGIEIPHYLINNSRDTDDIFFLEYHIGYWILGETPPTKAATHPSNITRDNLFPYMLNPRNSSMDELVYILEVIRPQTIIARQNTRVFGKKFTELNSFIDQYLDENYQLEKTIGRGLLYRRLE